jgi:uncharacterized protein YkwD
VARVVLIAAIVILAVLPALPSTAVANCSAPSAESATEQQLVGLINGYRNANGLPSLRMSTTLSTAAHWMANDLVTHSYFAHEPDSLGRSFAQRITDCGGKGYLGENVAGGGQTAAQTLAQWQSSPGHNAAMLNASFTDIGVAALPGGVYGTTWVADFGTAQGDGSPICHTDPRFPGALICDGGGVQGWNTILHVAEVAS